MVERLRDRKVIVLGLGMSGIAACRLCLAQGAQVLALDRKPLEVLDPAVNELRQQGVRVMLENDVSDEAADLMICSPGVPLSHPQVQRCRERKIPVYSEIELGSWFCSSPIVAVTGTDGKSTVVSMVNRVLQDQGRSTRLAGNIGYAFSQMILENPPDASTITILEVSSYQLELIRNFRPHIAAILNIAPDHISRHGDLESYARAKYRITLNQTPQDFLIRPLALPGSFQSVAQTLFWATGRFELPGAFYEPRSEQLTTRYQGNARVFSYPALSRLMPHQLQNFLATLAICLPLDVEVPRAVESLLAFPGLPHRLEFLGNWLGVNYYNDSKATNVHSCKAALEALNAPIILLAGGQPKQEDYSQLSRLLKRKVKLAVVFGEARQILQAAWKEAVPVLAAANLDEAIRLAVDRAEPGDTVLLSPACSSFDAFQNFEQRGNFFKSLVSELVIEKKI